MSARAVRLAVMLGCVAFWVLLIVGIRACSNT